MTLEGCLCDLLRVGGDFTLVRQLWSHLCLSLGKLSCRISRFLLFFFSSFFGNSVRSIYDYYSWYVVLFQSFLCQGLAPRVIRLMANGIATFKDYSVQFEKNAFVEHCYVLFWEGEHLKKVCVVSEPVDQPVPSAELVPLSRVSHSLESKQMPLCCWSQSQLNESYRG